MSPWAGCGLVLFGGGIAAAALAGGEDALEFLARGFGFLRGFGFGCAVGVEAVYQCAGYPVGGEGLVVSCEYIGLMWLK